MQPGVKTVLNKCRAGAALHKAFISRPRAAPVVTFFLEPGGGTITPDIALAAISSGRLTACGDGLFGGDVTNAQTWIYAPPAKKRG